MKKMMLVFAAVVVAAAPVLKATGEESAPKSSKREKALMRTGGTVENRAAAKGKIVFLDVCGAAGDTLQDVARTIDDELRCNVEIVSTNQAFTIAGASSVRKSLAANAVVAVVDDPALPMSLNAPEARWGIVNVAPLKADRPDASAYAARVRLAILRGFGYVCGAANSTMACLMFPAFRADDFDDARSRNFSPDTIMRIEDQFKAIGITQYPRTTYKMAAVAGWAPAPTNEYQRVIWEKVMGEKEQGPAVQRPIRRQGVPRKAK